MQNDDEEIRQYLLRVESRSSVFSHRAQKRKDRRNFILLFFFLCLILLFLWRQWIYL